jgi:hypothetical protein
MILISNASSAILFECRHGPPLFGDLQHLLLNVRIARPLGEFFAFARLGAVLVGLAFRHETVPVWVLSTYQTSHQSNMPLSLGHVRGWRCSKEHIRGFSGRNSSIMTLGSVGRMAILLHRSLSHQRRAEPVMEEF